MVAGTMGRFALCSTRLKVRTMMVNIMCHSKNRQINKNKFN